MKDNTDISLDENARRYYLDVMGIQCWQSLDPLQQGSEQRGESVTPEDDREVVVANWSGFEKRVQQCADCRLHEMRKKPITGRGDQSAELMFVLLSPTSNDDESGMLCSGEAGELFARMLSAIDIAIEKIYMTSLLKCALPGTRTASAEQVRSCDQYLLQQIKMVQPKLIIILGEQAARLLLQDDRPLDNFRAMNAGGQDKIHSLPLFVSYSPHELLQRPEHKREAWSDLQLLQKRLATL
ncbi:MAG TPA: hypothetical protein ENJ87_01550 [Gammaproteobacteria bacterium]|nr:hypothetical protein [Gammaproteobacteria bacterium]